ncbi:MAG: ABC transporter substrate-binding protein [Eubacteriales bacterium]|nr:ABC transporter substrate-binding protein [Eubacteriales bacterium]
MKSTKGYTIYFKRIFYALMSLGVLVLCACGVSETSAESDMTIAQFTLPPVEEETVPVQGGTLSFPIPENPATLNPLKVKNVELYNLFTLIYEQPVRIGVDGTAEPELAETWDVDGTGTVWTFNLREGVSWQMGNGEFTSADIIYTIDLIKNYLTDDSIYAKYNSMIADYKADDDYTVTITLSEPGNAAIYFMTFPVVCKAYCESGDIDTSTPAGTGPYNVVAYDEYEEMTLHANETWWKQAPYIQDLTAICYPDHDIELGAFEQNLLDFITTSALTVETYEKYNEKESIDYLTQYYDCLVPNAAGDIFSDVNIRRALAYALDKRDIISTGLLGHAVATDYPVAPDSYLSGEASNIYEYNPQKALALLEESGWEDRDDDGMLEAINGSDIYEFTIELLVLLDEDDTYKLDVAENIAAQLLECGINVVIDEQESESYGNKLQNGNFDIALCSFYLDHDQNPDITFMVGTGGSVNYGGFSDAEMDTLLQNCRTALGEEEMKEAYLFMESHFIDTIPQISLYYRTNALLYDVSVNIIGSVRDMNIFTTLPNWYIYTEDTIGSADTDQTADTQDTPSAEE